MVETPSAAVGAVGTPVKAGELTIAPPAAETSLASKVIEPRASVEGRHADRRDIGRRRVTAPVRVLNELTPPATAVTAAWTNCVVRGVMFVLGAAVRSG